MFVSMSCLESGTPNSLIKANSGKSLQLYTAFFSPPHLIFSSPSPASPSEQLSSSVCPPSFITASSYHLWLCVSAGVKAHLSSLLTELLDHVQHPN